MIRGSVKTFVGFEAMHNSLIAVAEESSCLSLAFENIIPHGWDSPAFVSNLTQYYHNLRIQNIGGERNSLTWPNNKCVFKPGSYLLCLKRTLGGGPVLANLS